MKRAIFTHRLDLGAILALLLGALVVAGYILLHQPSFSFGQSYYTVHAPFSTAAAVTGGQGQEVTIAGVQVGQVGTVSLKDGHADVTMNLYKQDAPVYRNATVLLRPRTPLKDMYLSLDPGSASAGAVPNGGTLTLTNTEPDVDVSQILSSLDTDTRNYLVLLLSGGAQAFRDDGSTATAPSPRAVADLRGALKRFEPLDRDTRTFASLLATRQRSIRRAIHNFNLVIGALGGVNRQFASLISSSDTNFSAISAEDAQLESALSLFPGTLAQTTRTFGKVRSFANANTSALSRLVPFARDLGPALRATRPLFRDTTSVIARQLRPFSVAVTPLARTLAPASSDLAKSVPALSRSIAVLDYLFDELAYQGRGSRHGYLFWGSWLAHNTDSLVQAQDANGPVVQGIFTGTCPELNFFEGQLQPDNQPLGVILDLLGEPALAQLPGAKPIPGTTQYSCPSSG